MPQNTTPESAAATAGGAQEFHMGWYGRHFATLTHAGSTWSFNYDSGWMLPLSCGEVNEPGLVPSFVLNLMPEWQRDGHEIRPLAMLEVFRRTDRFLSNVIISEDPTRIHAGRIDRLEGRLTDFVEGDTFCGQIHGFPGVNQELKEEMAKLIETYGTPCQSGVQMKLPCFLSEDGDLQPAGSHSFTHILKLPGGAKDPDELRGAMEWMSMSLARAGGVNTAEFSLVEVSDVLAYVTERFDVPVSKDDDRIYYCEDFCSVMDMTPSGKFFASLEEMMDALTRVSNRPEDAIDYFKLVYANRVLENADFHLKNAAILRETTISATGSVFESTRLSPAYDIMNTRFFAVKPPAPNKRESMVLSFNDDNHYSFDTMIEIGKYLGIDKEDAVLTMREVAEGIASKALHIANHMPEILAKYPMQQRAVLSGCARAMHCALQDFPDINPQPAATKRPRP